MPDLFVITSSNNSRELATWVPPVDLEEVHCPLNSGHQRGGRRVGELSVDIPARSIGSDFVWTWASDCLIKIAAAQTLADGHITGFETRSAHVTVGTKNYGDVFGEMVVTGWGGVASPASGVRLIESCPGCGLLRYSGVRDWAKVFGGREWDGSDLFMIWPLPRFVIATERAISFVDRARFTGIRVAPLAELAGASEELGPGRVSYWLCERRLEELKIDPAIR